MIEYAEADKALVAAAIQYLESMCPAVSDIPIPLPCREPEMYRCGLLSGHKGLHRWPGYERDALAIVTWED